MKTFKDYLIESAGGNYVCIDAPDLSDFWYRFGLQEPISGEAPPNKDYHCTLIFSKGTDINPKRVKSYIDTYFPKTVSAEVHGFECFDSIPKDGERDIAKSCIVMELDSTVLREMHKELKDLGLSHSYPEFRAHVTIRYNMSVEEAHFYKDKLNSMHISMKIPLSNFKSESINTNYV